MKKLFTLFIVLFHFFYLFATPIATLSVADVFLIIFVIILSLHSARYKKLTISKIGCALCFYIAIHCLMIVMVNTGSDALSIILPTLRIILYYFTVALFSKDYFDPVLGLKAYKWAAVISTIFLIIQIIVLNIFGQYIPGNIFGLPLLNQDLADFDARMLAGDIGHRPRSFFSEPSYYAIYVLLYLGIDLLALKKHDTKVIVLLTIGLLLSCSGTGIFSAAVIYIVFFIKNFRLNDRKVLMSSFLALVVLCLGLAIFTRSNSFQTFYDRTFVDETSMIGRFGTYENVFINNNDSMGTILFGRGVEKIDEYIAGVPRIYYYFGYIGMIVLLVLLIYSFKKKQCVNKTVLFLLIILSPGTEMLFSYMILPYSAFLVSDCEKLNGLGQ